MVFVLVKIDDHTLLIAYHGSKHIQIFDLHTMRITFDLELSYTRSNDDYDTYDIKKSEFKENEYYVLTHNGL